MWWIQDETPGENHQPDAEAIPSYHPTTIQEAVSIILSIFSKGDRANVRSRPREQFIAEHHYSLAMWIRNAMIHRNRNVVDLMADFQQGVSSGLWVAGKAEPDYVSGVLVGLVWDRVNDVVE